MIVEPLPSGATVVESSLDGCFDRAEILPGRIVFYLNHRTPARSATSWKAFSPARI